MTRPIAYAAGVLLLAGVVATSASSPLPAPGVLSTPADFLGPGTQPGGLNLDITPSVVCKGCHGDYDAENEPYALWNASLMAQSARDPMFWACLTVSEQEAPGVGTACLRCHTPGGFLAGHATPSDGSAIAGYDYDGVTCNLCHRLVDPFGDPQNPPIDATILASLANAPTDVHNGYYVVDPDDTRRGPYDLGALFPWHPFAQSPFHREALLCGTCHDNSNSLFTRVGGPVPSPSDSYVLNPMGQPSNASKYDMFPQQRTYSEWANSAFAKAPIDLGGKFGGDLAEVSTCQDCHMPDTSGEGCNPAFSPVTRADLPRHAFSGANTWVLNAVLDLDQSHALYGPSEVSDLTQADVDAALERNHRMLRDAAEMSTWFDSNGDLVVRVRNDSGHKLPTGFAEGRRMWLGVEFLDADCNLVKEHGAYERRSARLDGSTTKVWEIRLGVDAAASAATGAPQGEGFHYVLSNVVEKDNRIPPRGYSAARFAAVQAHPVGANYADGQYWDDTRFAVPAGATQARVRLWYQTTSREFVEFLRDANTTDDRGDVAYDLWRKNGKSAPFLMEERSVEIGPGSIEADVAEISVSQGGVQTIHVDAGPGRANQAFMVLGSMSGTTPSSFYGIDVPLVQDGYFYRIAFPPTYQPSPVRASGVLDAQGRATFQIRLAPGAAAHFAEQVLHHACLVIGGAPHVGEWVSCPVRLELRP
ncbi:MAG: multiheme c-type cytochrome [Planctomycetota bacterium]